MKSAAFVQFCCRLLASSVLVAALLVASLGTQSAHAASASLIRRPSGQLRPLAGCAPCIVAPVTPEPNSTVTPGPDGKVAISVTAQLNSSYTGFTLSIDKTDIDQAQVQITGDPTQPTLQYHASLTPGQHHAFVQVSDANGLEASFGWDFTVQAAPTPVPTATKTTGGGSPGNSGSTSSSSGFTPKTLSIILFSIAGLGFLVIIFIAGIWIAGNRELRKTR